MIDILNGFLVLVNDSFDDWFIAERTFGSNIYIGGDQLRNQELCA